MPPSFKSFLFEFIGFFFCGLMVIGLVVLTFASVAIPLALLANGHVLWSVLSGLAIIAGWSALLAASQYHE